MKRKYWSDEEKDALRKLHKALMEGKIEVDEFPKVLKSRTVASCRNMMDKLGLNYRITAAHIDLAELSRLTKVSKGV